jgi:hypothetical protein
MLILSILKTGEDYGKYIHLAEQPNYNCYVINMPLCNVCRPRWLTYSDRATTAPRMENSVGIPVRLHPEKP